jgi:hypothetical protein
VAFGAVVLTPLVKFDRVLVVLTVWLGQAPVMVTLVPATRAGVVVPVPPLSTASVPARVTAPDVPVLGVRPVVPPENVVTGVDPALLASNLTVPAAFLKYSFSSVVLIASSPFTKLVLTGTASAVGL